MQEPANIACKDTILIVDDTPDNLTLLNDVLKDKYRLKVANNGEKALRMAILENPPDLILLDIMMPDMDGYEVCKRLKSDDRTKNIPIIFLTAKAEEEDEQIGFELGAVDYITKPISIPILLARVDTHLKLKSSANFLRKRNEELRKLNMELESERRKTDKLLMNIMPSQIANDLKETGRTQPESFENVAVLFSDIVGFTSISSGLEPKVLINELNDIFTSFDNIIEANECERIKTIGDAYMAVCGLPVPNERYADNIVRSTVLIGQYLIEKNKNSSFQWKVKIGVHAGRVVGGVVGVKKYIYDVFGSTVNLASRLQSAAKIYQVDVLISDSVYNKLNYPEDFHVREIDTVRVKGELMPIRLYEVFDNDEENLREQKTQSLSVLKEGLELYKEGTFQEARQRFMHCQEICPPDFLPPIYIKRCNVLIRIPPGSDWSGVTGI